jgi:hypothetical protein
VDHQSWKGVLLPVDAPWWSVHFPPNGYGCTCFVRQVSRAEQAQMVTDGVEVPDAPVLDPATGDPIGQVLQIPQGVDPGWGYNPWAHRAGPPTGTPGAGAGPRSRGQHRAGLTWLDRSRA